MYVLVSSGIYRNFHICTENMLVAAQFLSLTFLMPHLLEREAEIPAIVILVSISDRCKLLADLLRI